MKREPNPDFLKELELEAPELASLSLERLPELLPAAEVPPRGRERLLADVSELPLRYAPFFDALASLWDLSEEDVRAELVRSKDVEEWRFTALVRFSEGFRFPVHRHLGHEKVFILEGSYTDSTGTVYRSGDLHEMTEGSEHGFVVDDKEPCVAAVVEEGREFRSVFLRVLSKFVRDG
jgi:hypothetical protein